MRHGSRAWRPCRGGLWFRCPGCSSRLTWPPPACRGSIGSRRRIGAEPGRGHDHDGDGRRPREPLGGRHSDVRRPEGPVRGTPGEHREHRHLQELQRRAAIRPLLPDRRWGQLHLRDRRIRRHRQPVRHVLEHSRPSGQEPARPLQRRHEPHGLAPVRLGPVHACGCDGPALLRGLSGVGGQAVQLR